MHLSLIGLTGLRNCHVHHNFPGVPGLRLQPPYLGYTYDLVPDCPEIESVLPDPFFDGVKLY